MMNVSPMNNPNEVVSEDSTAGLSPIGHVQCRQRYRYEAARQASIAPDNEAWIQLADDVRLRDGLRGLEGFERVWVIYELHLNETWHPLVQPPREDMGKLGVFATRAPHRPNRIGLSCVRLLGIEGARLHIAQHDLLDGTPVIDLKPYVPYADAFPRARAGWIDTYEERVFTLEIEDAARQQIDWVADNAGWDLVNFLQVQLRTDPTDARRKRVSSTATGYRIAFRTWRVDYRVDAEEQRVSVVAVHSGYAPADLAVDASDRYKDKAVHRDFIAVFGERE
jgi:tRNA (adenine37-N6)-methyltransferase